MPIPAKVDGGFGSFQDPPCTLNWGYMVPNSRYLGPNRGEEEGLGWGACYLHVLLIFEKQLR